MGREGLHGGFQFPAAGFESLEPVVRVGYAGREGVDLLACLIELGEIVALHALLHLYVVLYLVGLLEQGLGLGELCLDLVEILAGLCEARIHGRGALLALLERAGYLLPLLLSLAYLLLVKADGHHLVPDGLHIVVALQAFAVLCERDIDAVGLVVGRGGCASPGVEVGVGLIPGYLALHIFQACLHLLDLRVGEIALGLELLHAHAVDDLALPCVIFLLHRVVVLAGALGLLVDDARDSRVDLCARDLLQELRFLVAFGPEKVGEAVLCEDDGAGKLVVVEPDEPLYLALHIARIKVPVLRRSLCEGARGRIVGAGALHPDAPRGLECALGRGECDRCAALFLAAAQGVACVVGLEVGLLVDAGALLLEIVARGAVVEGQADGVENGAFARARIARDGKQGRLAERAACEVDNYVPPEGGDIRYFYFQYPHDSLLSVVVILLRRNSDGRVEFVLQRLGHLLSAVGVAVYLAHQFERIELAQLFLGSDLDGVVSGGEVLGGSDDTEQGGAR